MIRVVGTPIAFCMQIVSTDLDKGGDDMHRSRKSTKCESFCFALREKKCWRWVRKSHLLGSLTLLVGAIALSNDALAEDGSEVTNIELREGLLDTVQTALPERKAVDQSFLNPSYSPNITLNADSQLAITFLDEGAGYRNSLGYFAYQGDVFEGLSFGDIDTDNSGGISFSEMSSIEGVEVGMIFENASKLGGGGSLVAGDTVVLGGGSVSQDESGLTMTGGTTFEADTTVGFMVGANAWNGSYVKGWDGASGGSPVYYTEDFLNPENGSGATQGTATESSRHTAMQFASTEKGELIVGFEDLNRLNGSDDDFNDLVFLVQASPLDAIADANVPVFAAPAPGLGSGAAFSFLLLGFMSASARRWKIRTKKVISAALLS